MKAIGQGLPVKVGLPEEDGDENKADGGGGGDGEGGDGGGKATRILSKE